MTCSAAVAKRGHHDGVRRAVATTPSARVTLSSTRRTSPVARLTYHSAGRSRSVIRPPPRATRRAEGPRRRGRPGGRRPWTPSQASAAAEDQGRGARRVRSDTARRGHGRGAPRPVDRTSGTRVEQVVRLLAVHDQRRARVEEVASPPSYVRQQLVAPARPGSSETRTSQLAPPRAATSPPTETSAGRPVRWLPLGRAGRPSAPSRSHPGPGPVRGRGSDRRRARRRARSPWAGPVPRGPDEGTSRRCAAVADRRMSRS